MNALEAVAYVALGFAPMFAFMELSWRMGQSIRKRNARAGMVSAKGPQYGHRRA
ncbi:hypothetical protein [Nitrososphaera sp.]|uniref:hypothetical protein n=1 Tax=Nitrososphaera sp. TaxID=1971748 RepID=UPI00307DE413